MRRAAVDPALQPARQAQYERVRAHAGARANAPNRLTRRGVRAKEVGDERKHVVHLRVAALIRRLTRRHRVRAHPEAFDPAVDELIGLVKRYVVVDEIAEPLRNFGCEGRESIRKARIEQTRTAAGSLNVERPCVMDERNDRRHFGVADRLQYRAVVREGLVAPRARLGLKPRPRERESEHRAVQAARELDVFAITIPKVGSLAARNQAAHALPNVANVVASVVGLALMVGCRNAESKAAWHVRQMRDSLNGHAPTVN